jgi:hypothetical protein
MHSRASHSIPLECLRIGPDFLNSPKPGSVRPERADEAATPFPFQLQRRVRDATFLQGYEKRLKRFDPHAHARSSISLPSFPRNPPPSPRPRCSSRPPRCTRPSKPPTPPPHPGPTPHRPPLSLRPPHPIPPRSPPRRRCRPRRGPIRRHWLRRPSLGVRS